MSYEDFCNFCTILETNKPTYDEYKYIIQPVYAFHPVFDDNLGKQRCVEMYKSYGLGIFAAMTSETEYSEDMEKECENKRNAFGDAARRVDQLERELKAAKAKEDEAAKELRESQDAMSSWRKHVRKLWGCE